MLLHLVILSIIFGLADAWAPMKYSRPRHFQSILAGNSLGEVPTPSRDSVFYFAYGSNMNSAVFEGRRGIRPTFKIPAVALDTRLCFSAIGIPPFEPSFASVEPSKGVQCHGVLYEISYWDWLKVCASEGVPLGYQIVSLRTQPYFAGTDVNITDAMSPDTVASSSNFSSNFSDLNCPEVEALTLRFVQPQQALFKGPLIEPPGSLLAPSKRYMTLLREGAAEAGLAKEWRDKLDALPSGW